MIVQFCFLGLLCSITQNQIAIIAYEFFLYKNRRFKRKPLMKTNLQILWDPDFWANDISAPNVSVPDLNENQ